MVTWQNYPTHRTGPLLFTAQLSDGRVVRRHQDNFLHRVCNHPVTELVVPHTKMRHQVLPDDPTPPSIASEPANGETQSTETRGSPVKFTQSQLIVVYDYTRCTEYTRLQYTSVTKLREMSFDPYHTRHSACDTWSLKTLNYTTDSVILLSACYVLAFELINLHILFCNYSEDFMENATWPAGWTMTITDFSIIRRAMISWWITKQSPLR